MFDVDVVLGIVNTAGVVGVLAFVVFGFYKGHLISKVTLEDIVASTVRHVLEELKKSDT